MIGARTWMALALYASGCGSEIAPCDTPQEKLDLVEGFEICNQLTETPGPLCVPAGDTCKTSRECGGGLTCMKQGPADPSSAGRCFGDVDAGCQCRPLGFGRLAVGNGRIALQEGFSVGGMPSSVDTTAVPPRLTWQAPPDARYVACALFMCPPRFATFGCSPTAEYVRSKIDNFDQCVLLFDDAPATQPGFLLDHEHLYGTAPVCPGAPGPPRPVIELAAGCWAYDTTSIVAATELHPIRGSLLADLPGIPHDAACPRNGDACYDAAADLFGVCHGGACTPSCRSAADCELVDPTPSASGRCGWSCSPLKDQPLGACVRQP